jgi:hypothetical protein
VSDKFIMVSDSPGGREHGLLKQGDSLKQFDGVLLSVEPPVIEYRTLTALEIANKNVLLSRTPMSGTVEIDVVGGTSAVPGVDYNIIGSNIVWTGLDFATILSAGDILRIAYAV